MFSISARSPSPSPTINEGSPWTPSYSSPISFGQLPEVPFSINTEDLDAKNLDVDLHDPNDDSSQVITAHFVKLPLQPVKLHINGPNISDLCQCQLSCIQQQALDKIKEVHAEAQIKGQYIQECKVTVPYPPAHSSDQECSNHTGENVFLTDVCTYNLFSLFEV